MEGLKSYSVDFYYVMVVGKVDDCCLRYFFWGVVFWKILVWVLKVLRLLNCFDSYGLVLFCIFVSVILVGYVC